MSFSEAIFCMHGLEYNAYVNSARGIIRQLIIKCIFILNAFNCLLRFWHLKGNSQLFDVVEESKIISHKHYLL